MAIIKQHDKRTGKTYVYESVAYWDSEKKMSRAKRKLIGRLDPETGEIVPTNRRNKKKKVDYKALYEELLKKCNEQDELIQSLQEQISQLQKEKG